MRLCQSWRLRKMVQRIPASGLENSGGNFKNLIINGDMSQFQRATATTTVTSGEYQTADRFKLYENTDGAYTAELENLSVADQATTGQRTALELNVTTADGTIGASQFAAIYHPIEAQFLQHILYGTSAAKDLTLSFWVKSNKTGTYCVAIDKNDNTAYRLPIEYTISSADTWEKKVIHISPTAGSTSLITASGAAIDNDNGTGMLVTFALAWGSNYQGTNNTWVTGNAYSTSNQVNWMDSTDNNFYITGIQLEVGSGASDFEHLPNDIQLLRCQRYCQKFDFSASNNMYGTGRTLSSNRVDIWFPVLIQMRAVVDAISDSLTTTTIYRGDGTRHDSTTQTATALVNANMVCFGVRKTYSDTIEGDNLVGTQLGGTLIATCEL
jgi:hypothetical protein